MGPLSDVLSLVHLQVGCAGKSHHARTDDGDAIAHPLGVLPQVRDDRGTLLVFPSYLQHSVDANGRGETCLSVSFNLMFSAFTTALSKPLWGEE